ncbi:hypothetical protein E2562_001390 [Oryza meyeriana var. granulata]|uniref:Plastid lipid-associated protein/fibrillin conserved domain-containing protein n=1 Tax=Oryza meyeriana var. granulata TaxID=110450 RepID=A0A6G1DCR6_9ORYZ|nr:hypothetical protein E2562_001390 [Oryza meyeriana var. granulata]
MALVSLSHSLPCAAPASSLPLRAEPNASSSFPPLSSSPRGGAGRGRALGGCGSGLALAAAPPAGGSGSGRHGGRWRAAVSSFSFLPSFFAGNKEKEDSEKAERLKEELLAAIKPLDRGVDATPEDKERVEKIVQQLEEVSPVKEPLKSDLLNGKWELLYTTSESILQPERPKFLRPFGTIYQAINTDTLRAQNMETWPYFNQVISSKTDAYVPLS